MNNIKIMREKRGLTQKALADKAGVSAPYMYDLENGHRNAKPETWQRIAAVLECSVESLAGKEDKRCGERL